MFKDQSECLAHLKKNYTQFRNSLFLSSPKAIYDYYDKMLPLPKINSFLQEQDSYTILRESKKIKRNYTCKFLNLNDQKIIFVF